MATRWSGLAPAVDAHIHRMQVMRREQAAFRMKLLSGKSFTYGELMETMPRLGQWITFAHSYGMPQADGSVAPGVVLREHENGQLVTVHEEATIAGRQQFDMDDMRVAFVQMITSQE